MGRGHICTSNGNQDAHINCRSGKEQTLIAKAMRMHFAAFTKAVALGCKKNRGRRTWVEGTELFAEQMGEHGEHALH